MVISSKIIAIQLTNFLITSYPYLPKWWIYLRSREMQLEKKKKLKLKPWFTPALLKSIQTKNKIFKRLPKNSENLVLTEKYKAYQNALNRLLRLAKRNYNHSILNEHKGNSQKVWQVVNELAFTKNCTRL